MYSIEDKNKVLELRKKNTSAVEISKQTGVELSTVYRFCKNVNLPPINWKQLSIDKWKDEATKAYHESKNDPLFMLGVGLYWGEGSKTKELCICNSDPGIIKQWLKWCNKYIPERVQHFKLTLHKTSDVVAAIDFWNKNCNIGNIKIFLLKQQSKKDIDSIKHKMPNGVMYVRTGVGSFEEYTKMMAWLDILRNDNTTIED